MRHMDSILCWKTDQSRATVYFLTDRGLCGRIILPFDREGKMMYALMPHMMYWEKWCPYDFLDMRTDELPGDLRQQLDRIVAECTPEFPIGGNEEEALKQKKNIEAMFQRDETDDEMHE